LNKPSRESNSPLLEGSRVLRSEVRKSGEMD
jgi:hypothetical protein